MNDRHLPALRFLSLALLLPGLAGMIFAAMISTQYLADLPKLPVPSEMRMFPRNIHGTVVYQTAEEDRRLNEIEYSSVGVFLAGLGLGLVYMRKWGIAQALSAEDEGLSSEERA